MSFDLGVLAMDEHVDGASAAAMYQRCQAGAHPEGDPDERVIAFYESLRARFPDQADSVDSPWMERPLDIGIDHVMLTMSYSDRSTPALRAVEELAALHSLVIWDPQSSDVYLPEAETTTP
ncbi:hypothetical protein [Actinacidiphila sp. bgisy144]|uniref:hypothetical protein n=1 Tax=Actinacidiphila sp. bgisy144 TaxID=3413791 RepID=UPI003EBBFE14